MENFVHYSCCFLSSLWWARGCLKFRPRAPQLGKLQDANVWDLHTYMRSLAVKYASNKYVRRPHLPCVRVYALSSNTLLEIDLAEERSVV